MNNSVFSTNSPVNRRDRAATAAGQWIRAVGLALVVAIPLVVTPWGRDAYSQPKALVMYALVLAMLLGWLALRVISRQPRWTATRPELLLWTLLLAALVSSWVSVNARLTFFGGPGRHEGLLALCAYVALYFVGVHFFGSPAGLRDLSRWTAAAGTIVVIYGVLQSFLPPLFEGEALTRTWYAGLGVLRVPSTVGGPVVFGGYLAFLLPCMLALALTHRGTARLIWLGGSCLAILALVMTLTRAAWLAAAVGLVTWGVVAGTRLRRREPVVLGAAVVLSAAFLVTIVGTPQQAASRMATSLDADAGSVAQRIFIWRETIRLIGRRPLVGWGMETLREVFPYDREVLVRYFGERPVIIDRAHNDILQTAVSIGVPGAMAAVGAWVLVVISALHLVRRGSGASRALAAGWLGAVAAYLVQVQFSFSTVALTPLVWLMAGAACGWETTIAQSTAGFPATGRAGSGTGAHPRELRDGR